MTMSEQAGQTSTGTPCRWTTSSPVSVSTPNDGLGPDEVQRRLGGVRAQRDRHRTSAHAVGGGQGSAGEPDEHHAAHRQHRQLRHRSGGHRRRSCWRWCRSTSSWGRTRSARRWPASRRWRSCRCRRPGSAGPCDRRGRLDGARAGDVVLIEAGDLVPADARIVTSASLEVQEAPPPKRPVHRGRHEHVVTSPCAGRTTGCATRSIRAAFRAGGGSSTRVRTCFDSSASPTSSQYLSDEIPEATIACSTPSRLQELRGFCVRVAARQIRRHARGDLRVWSRRCGRVLA